MLIENRRPPVDNYHTNYRHDMKLSLFSVTATAAVAVVLTSFLLISWSESSTASRELLRHQYDDADDNDNSYNSAQQYYKARLDNGQGKRKKAGEGTGKYRKKESKGKKQQSRPFITIYEDKYNISNGVPCGLSVVPNLEEIWDPNRGITITPPTVDIVVNNSRRKRPSKRIHGGMPIQRDMFPWLVEVSYASYKQGSELKRVSCSGTLISMSHVLTYKGCYMRAGGDEKLVATVKAGHVQYNETKDVQIRKIKLRSISHHSSSQLMAVLELDSPLNYDKNVRPICLPPERKSEKTPSTMEQQLIKGNLTIIGFGAHKYNRPFEERDLPHLDVLFPSYAIGTVVTLTEHKYCQKLVNAAGIGDFQGKYHESAFHCSFETKNRYKNSTIRAACHQDEGAPGMFFNNETQRWTLYGIVVSTSINCDVIAMTVFNKVDIFEEVIATMTKRLQIGHLDKICGIETKVSAQRRRKYNTISSDNEKRVYYGGKGKINSHSRQSKSKRIYGGREAIDGELPWLVRVVAGTVLRQTCTGTIIHREFILTAAHCLLPTSIVAGSHSDKKFKQVRLMKQYLPHPDYKLESSVPHEFTGPNIALLQLDKPLEWNDYVRPACLPTSNRVLEAGTNITIGGFGAIANNIEQGATNSYVFPKVPHIGRTVVLEGLHCNYPNLTEGFCSPSSFRYPSGPEPNKMFATSACTRDSGAPALYRNMSISLNNASLWEVYGVVSTTESEFCQPDITHYMLVPHVREWIFSTIATIMASSPLGWEEEEDPPGGSR